MTSKVENGRFKTEAAYNYQQELQEALANLIWTERSKPCADHRALSGETKVDATPPLFSHRTNLNMFSCLPGEKESRPYSPYTATHHSSDQHWKLSIHNFTDHQSIPSLPPSPRSTQSDKDHYISTPSLRSSPSSSSLVTEKSSLHDRSSLADMMVTVPPQLSLPLSERDAYGFKRPVEWVDIQELETFQVYYQRILARQAEKWRGYMKENKGHWPSKDAKLIRYARKGIPQELRAKAWLHYSGAQHKMDTCVGHYEELLQQAEEMGDRNEYADIIQRDLHRTFPDNSHFCCAVSQEDGSVTMDPSTNDHLQKLKRVLLAFSLYLPQVGYCQSLNFLAGYFILLLEEEEAFWLLVMTITEYFPPGMFDSSLEGATIEQAVLMQSIYEKMPGVWNKIANKRCFWECEQTNRLPSITLVTGHWFMTLFINILPVETVLRVWDSLYIEGYVTLFRAALTILKICEPKILAIEDPIDTFQILQKEPRRLFNCHRFIATIFEEGNISYDVKMQEIEERRLMFRNRQRQRQPLANTPHTPTMTLD